MRAVAILPVEELPNDKDRYEMTTGTLTKQSIVDASAAPIGVIFVMDKSLISRDKKIQSSHIQTIW